MGKWILFGELILFYGFLFAWMGKERLLFRVVERTEKAMEASTVQRAKDKRKSRVLPENRNGILYELEKRLVYSGISERFPVVTPEIWILCNLILSMVIYFLMALFRARWWIIFLVILGVQIVLFGLVSLLMARNYNRTEGELLKFLDFLGNYSITSGEISSIFYQMSPYLEEPLRGALRECYYEASAWGDVSMALFALEDKLQHPKMKEIVRNLETTMRYSADYKILVNQSRKSVREYLRLRSERKSMMREAYINLLLLLGMTMVVFMSLEGLFGIGLGELLFANTVGRIGGIVILVIIVAFYIKIRKLAR